MIIPAETCELPKDRVELAEWLRAPLSMNRGAHYFSVYDVKPRGPGKSEIIISTIDPSLWDDIWRLEVVTKDEPGNLFLILTILNHLGVNVVASEGSISASGRRHAMSFIITCHAYATERDKSSIERAASPRATLPDLEFIMKLNLVDQLGFTDKKHPRLRISRMDEFKRLFDDIRSARRVIRPKLGERLNGRTVKIDRAYIESILASGSQLMTASAVDTKNRIIRILVFEKGNEPPFHVRFAIDNTEIVALRRITELLFQANCNVIRYQLRRGSSGKSVKPRSFKDEDRSSRLDFLLEGTEEGQPLDAEDIVKVCEQIAADRTIRHCGVRLVKGPAGGNHHV